MGEEIGFSVDQLMELAGLSVAQSIYDWNSSEDLSLKRVLVVAGPGNNGGDGLVAARHLTEFGFSVDYYYPKKTNKDLYMRLVKQLRAYKITEIEKIDEYIFEQYDLIVDGIFGFSFKGEIRDPFKEIIELFAKRTDSRPKIASIDVPSGWQIDDAYTQTQSINETNPKNTEKTTFSSTYFIPDLLISLTLPKLCVKHFPNPHYLGGRFIPITLKHNFPHLTFPDFPNSTQILKLH